MTTQCIHQIMCKIISSILNLQVGDSMDKFTVGNRIKYERERMDISQLELGKIVGVTKQCVSGWEVGRTTPDVVTLNELAKLFGISLIDFLNENFEDDKRIDLPKESNKFTERELRIISRLRTLPNEYFTAIELLLGLKGKK